MMRGNHSEEEKFAYYQQFNILYSLDKSYKTLKLVEFTSQEHQDFPKVAILKQFYRVREEYKKEAKFLEDLSALHPNIVKHYYHTEFEGTFRIFMEYCYGSVSKVIEWRKNQNTPWTDSELINHFITIAGVIEILHKNNYIHGDMKPDNIFVKDDEKLRIGDFGEPKEIRIGESKYTANGTEIYMSSIYLEYRKSLPVDEDGKKISDENRAKKEEIWSLGKTFYEMAALDLYANFFTSENEIFKKVDEGLQNRPAQLIRLLKWMLADDYKNRPKIEEVLEELQKIAQETETTHSHNTTFSHDTTRQNIGSIHHGFKEGNALSAFPIKGFSSNQNGLGGDFHNPHSSDKRDFIQEEIKQDQTLNSCELCNSDELTHDCGYKYCKDQFLNFAICSLYINTCSDWKEVVCIECRQPFPFEIYNCPNNHFKTI